MSNAGTNSPSFWKMRNGREPVPVGQRDQFRAARGIFWWLSASIFFWSSAVAVVLWLSWQ